MKKQYFAFTMIELLVVIAIIALLAGLITPAVISAQQQGRITQAKSDMQSIMMALKGMEGVYGRMVKISSGNASFNGESVAVTTSGGYNYLDIGNSDAYDALIAELTDPGNSGLSSPNLNKRKQVFLDPQGAYDPSLAFDNAANLPHLWRDPWGNRYRIFINSDGEFGIPNPADTSKILAVKVAVVSCGPNGAWDSALNIDFPDEGTPTGDDDDIASWRN